MAILQGEVYDRPYSCAAAIRSHLLKRVSRRPSFPFGDHSDLDVLCQAQNLRNQAVSGKKVPAAGTRSGEENLGNLVTVGEIHQSLGRTLAIQYSRLNMKVACEVEMPLNGLPL